MASKPGVTGSFWPSGEQELLLRTVLLDRQRAEAAWLALRPTIDIQRLERGSASLLGLLYERLHEWGTQDEFVPRLKGVFRFIWFGNQVGLQALTDAVSALHEGGVRTLALGDAALILRYYGKRGVRPLADPAVLVPRARFDAAIDVLERAGWETWGTPSGRSQGIRRSADGRRCVVRWRLPMELESLEDGSASESYWQRAVAADTQGFPTSVLSTTDEFLSVCVGGAKTASTSRVQWVADAMTILGTHPSEVVWERVVDEAVAHRLTLRLADALAYLVEAFEAPVPAAVVDELRAATSSGRERFAHQLSGRGGPLLGSVPATIGAHIVASQETSVVRAVVTAPRFVRAEWGLDRAWALPMAAVRRTGAAISAALKARRHRRVAS